MEKDFELIELFEIYKGLLTERQRELFTSHYLLDLSLNEIAEPENLSRQSVFDAIKKVKQKLNEYESQLKLREKFTCITKVLQNSKEDHIKQSITEILGR